MKLGLFDHMQKHDSPARSYVDLYKSHLEVLEFADQAGLDFYFVAEHHFDMGFSECPSPGAFLGAASQRTRRIRLGPLVYVLPLWNPIRVAEEVALLDNLTEGRVECGFGAGIGPFSFAAYNIPWDQKREMRLEALGIIKGIWTHESFSFEGRYFKCKYIDSSIPLVQKPHPPLWMPTRSKDSIEEAASTGVSTVQWVQAGMKAARIGAKTVDIERAAEAVIKPGLLRLGLITDATGPQFRTWYTHGICHWIGMDVHDVGDYKRPLKAGMAFVIEPGLYIRPEALEQLPDTPENRTFREKVGPSVTKYAGIGVRIEDSFLLTESRLVQLSAKVPRTIKEIDDFMRTRR